MRGVEAFLHRNSRDRSIFHRSHSFQGFKRNAEKCFFFFAFMPEKKDKLFIKQRHNDQKTPFLEKQKYKKTHKAKLTNVSALMFETGGKLPRNITRQTCNVESPKQSIFISIQCYCFNTTNAELRVEIDYYTPFADVNQFKDIYL